MYVVGWKNGDRVPVKVDIGAAIVGVDCGVDYCMMLGEKG